MKILVLYFESNARVKEANKDVKDLKFCGKLWDVSAKLVGL